MTLIAPSILSADFADLGREVRRVSSADWLHVDVMDGMFVSNISIGVPVVKSLRKATDMFLDVHLMIEKPVRYIDAFADAGADLLSIHLEADMPPGIRAALDAMDKKGVKKGIVLRPITAAERRHILALAQEHRAGLWVLTILYAGLRPGETAALSWKDIDFDRNEIHVYKAIESGTKTVKAPKTPAGVRDIPMRQELRDRLLDAQGCPDDLVFPAPAGGVRSANSLQRLWGSFAHALDLHMGAKVQDGVITKHALAPDLTPYCLRHTFCTDLQRAGVPINVAKELMGHANISVTANIYTHRDQKVLHSNMAKLNPNGRKPSTKPRPKEL